MGFYDNLVTKIEQYTELSHILEKQSGDIKDTNTFAVEITTGSEGENYFTEEVENYSVYIYVSTLRNYKQEWERIRDLIHKIQSAIKQNLSSIGIIDSHLNSWRKNFNDTTITEIEMDYEFRVLNQD